MKVTDELAKVFIDACKHVDTWEGWQRSLDPQGNEARTDTEQLRVERGEQSAEQIQLKRSA